ncbi:hypothetical protein ASPWEDRAFT_171862 [Aspergillus wentii DTO 134E9]|uniref:Uncharacterized protein n=1 Tax=Aspergillus wentii DTO 134E9 TaxID=1073089 RepID=A0A1L9RJF6_ASPWE|nr:uncharacterized protein ASPWEDRAFT_171862 [Aspergillus wentii DTO 134E9]KAI9932010.1 hypothetical protein MW887_009513 [Aspergillus wentii]OJJ35034.1 hypothetical protein ASPWEDRAFT_171862 [Aspergillus wentii DTO 134E9]
MDFAASLIYTPTLTTNIMESNQIPFLSHLPDNTPNVTASTSRAVKDAIRTYFDEDGPISDYVIISDVKQQVVDGLIEDPRLHGRINMRMFYNEDIRKLIVKLPRAEHEKATHALSKLIYDETFIQGMNYDFTPCGATTFRSAPYSKEGDMSFMPERPLLGRNQSWPTVVIETGASENIHRLRLEAEWWITQSRGLVKTIVIISIERTDPRIAFEVWKLQAAVSQHHHQRYALRTFGTPIVPTKAQEVVMRRSGNATVTNGAPLIICFEDLFLRTPSSSVEKDYSFNAVQLEEVAHRVWRGQGFM